MESPVINVFELPFNNFIGLAPSDKTGFLLMLNAGEKYLNHLNTVHASAQFALAEATSGFFLLNEFQQLPDIIPVVRKVETKYKKPVEGTVYSKAGLLDTDRMKVIDELDKRKRALLTVRVSLFDSGQVNVMQSDFEWFIAKNS